MATPNRNVQRAFTDVALYRMFRYALKLPIFVVFIHPGHPAGSQDKTVRLRGRLLFWDHCSPNHTGFGHNEMFPKLKSDYNYTSEYRFQSLSLAAISYHGQIDDTAEAGRNVRRLRGQALTKVQGGLRAIIPPMDLPGKNPLKEAQEALDTAVLAAYGFSPKKDILAQLLALNLEVSGREQTDEPVTAPGIPPGYPDPARLLTDDCILCTLRPERPAFPGIAKPPTLEGYPDFDSQAVPAPISCRTAPVRLDSLRWRKGMEYLENALIPRDATMTDEPFDDIDSDEDDSSRPGYFTSQGYAWYAYPISDSAPATPYNFHQPDPATRRSVDYSGPVDEATGLLNKPHDGAYLIVTHDEAPPKLFDGWDAEPADLNHNFETKQIGTFRLVRELRQKDPDIKPFKRYEFRRLGVTAPRTPKCFPI